MADQYFEMTQKNYEDLKKELDYLVKEKRPEIIERIAEARSHGDLSENAEYDAAREEQRQAHQQRENAACSHWNEPPCRFPNFSDEFASSTSLYHEGRARTIRTRPKPRNLR